MRGMHISGDWQPAVLLAEPFAQTSRQIQIRALAGMPEAGATRREWLKSLANRSSRPSSLRAPR